MEKIRNQELCDKLTKLTEFIEFLGNLLTIVLTNGKNNSIESLIVSNFRHLTLDLKKSGGKIKKAKTLKRRKMKAKANKKKTKNYR
jgi:hypothetical protein